MQTSYPIDMPMGKVGNLYDISKSIKKSGIGTLAIPFGRFVCRDADDDKVKLPGQSSDVTGAVGKAGGVSLATHALESVDDGLAPHYPAKAVLSILEMGKVLVLVEEDVDQGDQAFVRYTGKGQIQTLTFSAVLVTGNTVTGTVNGAPISVAFNTNHATTMADLETAIEAVSGVASATVSGNVITVLSNVGAQVVMAAFQVSGGASQATATVVETYAGLNTTGTFRKTADSSTAVAAPGYYYGTSAKAGELAVLEVNIK